MGGNHYTWSNPRVLLTVALIFLCGALVGALATTVTTQSAVVTTTPGGSDDPVAPSLEQLTTELDLNESQQQRLRVILDDYFQFYHALQDQLDGLKADGRRNITDILNEQQRVKFEKILTEAGDSKK